MKPHMRTSLLRRIVMWAAGVVLGLSVAAWVAGFWFVTVDTRLGFSMSFMCGDILITEGGDFWSVSAEGFELHAPAFWLPGQSRLSGFLGTVSFTNVPLWIPTIGSAGVLIPMWWAGYRPWNGRRRAGECPSCGYDLAGIDGVCPECGSTQGRRA